MLVHVLFVLSQTEGHAPATCENWVTIMAVTESYQLQDVDLYQFAPYPLTRNFSLKSHYSPLHSGRTNIVKAHVHPNPEHNS